MLSRFELFVILRNQVRDRALARRALAVEAVCSALARLVGADAELWGLLGLGADIDVVLTAGNSARRGAVAEEILVTEGVPADAARAARDRFELEPDAMSPLARALVVADAMVHTVFAAEMPLEAISPAYLARRLAEAAGRGDSVAEPALACLALLGADLDATAAASMAALLAVREDLGR
jgi:predicted hydrolase (HD superfamily)